MTKVPLNVSISQEDSKLIRELNAEIENQTNLKLGVSRIVASLIKTLNHPGMRERTASRLIAHKREKIRQTIMRAAERAIKKAG